jgi:predicted GH43/DUF377 family glycosyl hydrolase
MFATPAVVAAESVTSLKVLVTEPPTRSPEEMSEMVGIVPRVVVKHGFVSTNSKSMLTGDVP